MLFFPEGEIKLCFLGNSQSLSQSRDERLFLFFPCLFGRCPADRQAATGDRSVTARLRAIGEGRSQNFAGVRRQAFGSEGRMKPPFESTRA